MPPPVHSVCCRHTLLRSQNITTSMALLCGAFLTTHASHTIAHAKLASSAAA